MSVDLLVERGAGRVVEHAPLGALTTYRVGGSVRALVQLRTYRDLEELGPLLGATGLEMCVIGNGSNLLVADGEQDILALKLGDGFSQLDWHDDGGQVLVSVGAGLDLPVAARRLSNEGICGFEWAVGVPGTMGGAVMMNAGGHGSDVASSLESARIWRNGVIEVVGVKDLHLDYRSSALAPGQIVVGAELRLLRGDARRSGEQIREIVRWRREHQPGGANGGSVFRNPSGEHAGRLIELSGCKGLRYNSAQVSEKHANFFVVEPAGRASDVYALIEIVRDRVLEVTGVALHCEHHFVGFEELG